MKKQIRRNVFETNSSSTHSLTIGNGNKEFPELNENGNIEISLSQYGWEKDEYYGLNDRVSYVFSYLYNHREGEEYSNIEYTELYNKLIEYIKEQTGANDIEFTGCDDYCYVDHGSEHMQMDFEWLIDFMFNSGGFFTTDNNN